MYRLKVFLKKIFSRLKRHEYKKFSADEKIVVIDLNGWHNLYSGIVKMAEQSNYTYVSSLDMIEPKDYSKIIVFIGAPPKKSIKEMKNLQWLQLPSSGANGYEEETLYDNYKSITITNSAGVYGIPISEYVIGTLLLMCKTSICNNLNRNKLYTEIKNDIEFKNTTILILGLGDIGQNIAKRCKALECGKIIGIRKNNHQSVPNIDEIYSIEELKNIVGQADFVISALPDTKDTKSIFNLEIFEKMKQTAIFVNVGRGSAVVNEDLVYAIKKKMISGAILDASNPSPMPWYHKMKYCRRILITNHSSSISGKNSIRAEALYIEQINRFIKGEKLKNIIKEG